MLHIQENDPFKVDLLKEVYSYPEDLKLAWPTGKDHFCEDTWRQWFLETKEKKCHSLLFFLEDKPVGHVALMCYKKHPGLAYLCFVLLNRDFRGKGLGRKMVADSCRHFRKSLRLSEVHLQVRRDNPIAQKNYVLNGFEPIAQSKDGKYLKMRKNLLGLG